MTATQPQLVYACDGQPQRRNWNDSRAVAGEAFDDQESGLTARPNSIRARPRTSRGRSSEFLYDDRVRRISCSQVDTLGAGPCAIAGEIGIANLHELKGDEPSPMRVHTVSARAVTFLAGIGIDRQPARRAKSRNTLSSISALSDWFGWD